MSRIGAHTHVVQQLTTQTTQGGRKESQIICCNDRLSGKINITLMMFTPSCAWAVVAQTLQTNKAHETRKISKVFSRKTHCSTSEKGYRQPLM